MSTDVVIGLSAVILSLKDGDARVLTVRRPGARQAGLPFGPFAPDSHRTFELALKAFVTRQTGFSLGYVEQLYTFGDKGRDAPLADVGAGAARVISVGYLALAPAADDTPTSDSAWDTWSRYFPYEDWRRGRPSALDSVIAPALAAWSEGSESRRSRARLSLSLIHI